MNRECVKCESATPTSGSSPAGMFGNAATMGHALETFQKARNLSSADLASWLSTDEESLEEMAEIRRPEPDESDFHMRCHAIARSTGSDAFAVRTLLRWLRAGG